ncbi:MAG TPA: DUF177 domain-containing protein [Bacilli bacterium]|nr:DUF177 domain-containing protein [Bacilli bacterium]
MKWTVQQLYSLRRKEILINETIDLDEIKQVDPQIRQISPVEISGKVTSSDSLITFQLRIKGVLTLPCSRTLEDVSLPFDIETKENYLMPDTYSYHSEDDEDVHIIEGDVIDLIPVIKEHILLAIPLQIYADDADKKGLQSGEDWELLTEETKQNRIDPRLADLAKFFDKQNEK